MFHLKFNIPLICSSHIVIEGPHGMGSGSGGTNVDETIVHRVLQHSAAIKSNSTLNKFSQCNGDDGVLTFPGLTKDKVIDTYTSMGLEMNPTKQYLSTQDCIYLRR